MHRFTDFSAHSLVVVLLAVAGFLVAQPAPPSGGPPSRQTKRGSSSRRSPRGPPRARSGDRSPTTSVALTGFTPVARDAAPGRARRPAAPVAGPRRRRAPGQSKAGQRAAASSATPTGYGCAAALAYLAANAAPGFTFQCPGNA